MTEAGGWSLVRLCVSASCLKRCFKYGELFVVLHERSAASSVKRSHSQKTFPRELMTTPHSVDLNRLATHLRSRLEERGLSARSAAEEIGFSPTTLGRLLQGADAPTMPETANLIRAASWLGRSLSAFESTSTIAESSIADVEVHLRALPGLNRPDAEALVAMVHAAYDAAKKRRETTRKKR